MTTKQQIQSFIDYVCRDEVPPNAIWGMNDDGDQRTFNVTVMHEAQFTCQSMGMYAMVALDWVADLAAYLRGHRVLEVMAGRGWLAKALMHHGVVVTATDDLSWGEGRKWKPPLVPVLRLEAEEAVRRFGAEHDVLLVSWPPYDDDGALRAARAWGDERPIVYVGEDKGGCMADDAFFDACADWPDAPHIFLPQWWAMHDTVWVCRYGSPR